MSRDPVADDGGELSDLEVDVLRGTVTEKILIQPDLGPFIARVEAPIHARLREDVNVRPDLRVEEQAQPRVEQKIATGKDEGRRGLIDEISLEIDKSAQLKMKMVMRIVQGKRVMNFFEKIGASGAARAQDQRKNQRQPPA